MSLGGNPFGDVDEVLRPSRSSCATPTTTRRGRHRRRHASDRGPDRGRGRARREAYSFDDWQGGQGLLEFLEAKGVKHLLCRQGECSACACLVLEGEVTLIHNEVLDEDDLAEGIRLVCQARAATEKLRSPMRLSDTADR